MVIDRVEVGAGGIIVARVVVAWKIVALTFPVTAITQHSTPQHLNVTTCNIIYLYHMLSKLRPISCSSILNGCSAAERS